MEIDSKDYFNKKFKLPCDGVLPELEAFFSSDRIVNYPPLVMLKSIVNHVKGKLNDYQIEDWSRHTRNRNPAQQILSHLKSEIGGEFVTQAFAKFYECVSAYPMVNNVGEVYQSIHLCEAPGAFIASLNHFLKLNHPASEVSRLFPQNSKK